jgi:hypothetical protein
MPITDFWMLDGFMASFPPADILVAAYLGYKPQKQRGRGQKPSMRDAAKMNSEALAKMPVRRNVKTLADMPAFLRTPDQLKLIEEMQREWKSSV